MYRVSSSAMSIATKINPLSSYRVMVRIADLFLSLTILAERFDSVLYATLNDADMLNTNKTYVCTSHANS